MKQSHCRTCNDSGEVFGVMGLWIWTPCAFCEKGAQVAKAMNLEPNPLGRKLIDNRDGTEPKWRARGAVL